MCHVTWPEVAEITKKADNASSASCLSTESDAEERVTCTGRGTRGRQRQRRVGRGRGRAERRGSRGTSRGRGGGSRSRSRGRGREITDVERVQSRREEKQKELLEHVKTMETEKLRGIVVKVAEREPGLIFDLLEDDSGEPVSQPSSSSPSWCKCGKCREMPTEIERKCCNCLPQNCISLRDQMDRLCLDREVLALGQAYHREMLGRYREPVEDYNKSMRHAAYRNFVLWKHGRLGAGNRKIIPSCCVWRIRDSFPDRFGHYEGFNPSRFF